MKKNWVKNTGSAVWVAAWIVLSMQLTSTAGVVASAIGSLLGLFVPGILQRMRVRDSIAIAGSAVFWALAWMVSGMLRNSSLVFSMLGTEHAYAFIEIIFWGGAALGFTALLQVFRNRFPALIVLQVLFAGSTLAAILAAHRDGAQHRPYFLVDPLLLRGSDPVPFLLLAGVAVGLAILIWVYCQSTGRKRLRDPLALLVLLAAALLLIPNSASKIVLRLTGGGGGGDQKENAKDSQKKGGRQSKDDKGKGSDKNRDPDPDNAASKGQPQPVALVTFHDDYDPPEKYYYFRQTAASTYRNDRLVPEGSGQFDTDIVNAFPTGDTTVRSSAAGPAAEVHTTVTLLVPHSRPFGLISPATFSPAPNPDPGRFERAYEVDSKADSRDIAKLMELTPGVPGGGDEAMKHYLECPTDPRFKEILDEALTLLKPEYRDNPLYRAYGVKMWFYENVVYNLQAKHDRTSDPVADFLFGDRNGYCVHFAQSAALLYRLAGVPSRVATGYAVDARRRGHGSALMIVGGDAHAWPEVYLQGAGWVALDISSKRHVGEMQPPPDPEQQRMLGQMARPLDKKKNDEFKPASATNIRGIVWKTLLAALIAALCILYAGKLWRRIAVHVCKPAKVSRLAFVAALDRLAEVSLVRQPAQTREQFSVSLAEKVPSLVPLTELHVEEAFGAPKAGRSRTQYLQLLRSVSKEIYTAVPLWRAALAFFDPWSWTRVR